jgi:hypothetical protein
VREHQLLVRARESDLRAVEGPLSSSGLRPRLQDNVATQNGLASPPPLPGERILSFGPDPVITGNVAGASGGDGFVIQGSGAEVGENLAFANGISGFKIGGTGHAVTGNVSRNNLVASSVRRARVRIIGLPPARYRRGSRTPHLRKALDSPTWKPSREDDP